MHIAQPTIAAAPDATVSEGKHELCIRRNDGALDVASLNICDFEHSAAE